VGRAGNRHLRVGIAVSLPVVWIALLSFAGPLSGALHPSTSSAYQYEYDFVFTMKGDGTFNGSNGKVSFTVSAKNDHGVSSGSCTVSESPPRTRFKCLSVTSLVVFEHPGQPGVLGSNMIGTGTLNGTPMTYLIAAGDFGEPGVGQDSFFICASPGQTCLFDPSAGQFVRSGILTSGNIQLKQ
jgi:hypothetical protein